MTEKKNLTFEGDTPSSSPGIPRLAPLRSANLARTIRDESSEEEGDHRAPGTFVLVLILLATFAVYYFANWKALADVWHVR
jgi:hypothetical protein